MSPPAANTRSRSATPNNTPAKAHAGRSSNPPASVGKLLSALTLRGSSPESENGQQTATSLLRVNLFAFLGANPKAHEDDQLRAEFSSLLEEYTKAERAVSSDPLFCIGRNYFGMKEYKLVLIGGASVGKSAYVEKLKSNRLFPSMSRLIKWRLRLLCSTQIIIPSRLTSGTPPEARSTLECETGILLAQMRPC